MDDDDHAEERAPFYAIPYSEDHSYAGIEYPGPVSSIPRALNSIGGLPFVSTTLENPPDPTSTIELSLNPKNRFHHPVQSTILESGNIVMKIVKRRRKRPKLGDDGREVDAGVFTMEAVGVASKTVRFRGMADFQYGPSVPADDPIISIAQSMENLDVAAIQSFDFPAPNEVFSEDQYLPPPVFSRSAVPQSYDYRPVPASVQATSVRPSGEEVQRLINVSRWKGRPMTVVSFDDADVPTEPEDDLVKMRKPATDDTERNILKCLEDRPVWTRTGLLNQLSIEDARAATNNKHIVSMCAYSFSDGPFRDLVIRWGYDPRKDPAARFFQHISLRNVANVRTKKAIAAAIDSKAKGKDVASRLEHVFDGVTVHSKIGNFQLIDIPDPLIAALIRSPVAIAPSCSADAEGWYHRDHFEQIRNVVRRKFIGILSGVRVLDSDCDDLLGEPPKAARRRGSVGGSGTDGEGSAGSGSGSGGEGGGKKGGKKAEKRKAPGRAPWETGGKKKGRGARAPARDETDEEKAARLREVIGMRDTATSAAGSSPGGASRDGEGMEE